MGSALIAAFAGWADSVAQQADPLAGAPVLERPIDCLASPGGRCWIQTFMDHDLEDGVSDSYCGSRTDNRSNRFGQAHQGLDIGPLDWAAWDTDIRVLAAAAGTVRGTRDGLADAQVTKDGRDALEPQACGNGVRIDHGGGWQTMYCHLKQGSVSVSQGQRVEAGQPLGLVGSSGLSSFPHLHFQVMRQEGTDDPATRRLIPYDPYTGAALTEPCVVRRRPLWSAAALRDLPYTHLHIIKFGFAGQAPNFQNLLKDLRPMDSFTPKEGQPLYAFAYTAGTAPGDTIKLHVEDGRGRTLLSGTLPLKKRAGRHWAAADVTQGRSFKRLKTAEGAWPDGPYRLVVSVVDSSRDGVEEASTLLELNPAP
ncbi:M23 family metallopeptidase [Eilatimonas milleporae]|uniref:Peptidase M23-like protein n=1 Tax=Eilatimonas milleporae TaxID=911205 RepID=A0A3M0CVQ6_9PROT|nr:M23 family metallopeptidase [Eilatimonas milleporae]RMB07723.1 peptidase M23-like protein [Eilatimonas milleporae]